MYYRGAQAAIIVYDIRRHDTYDKAKRWISELKTSTASALGLVCALASAVAVPTTDRRFFSWGRWLDDARQATTLWLH